MKNLYLSILLSLLSLTAWSQPNWQITPSDYEFSMSFTGVVLVSDEEVVSNTGMLSAWVNGELRGVTNAVAVPNTNRVYFLLNVYSNSVSKDTISFIYYDADADSQIQLSNEATFAVLENEGTYSNPYVFETPPGVQLLSFNIVGHEQDFAFDADSNIIDITLREDADLSALTASFEFSFTSDVRVNNIPQVSGVSTNDFSDTVSYLVSSSVQNSVVTEFKTVVQQGAFINEIDLVGLDFEADIQNESQYVKLNLTDSTDLSDQELVIDFAHADSVVWNDDLQNDTLAIAGDNLVQLEVYKGGVAETWTVELRQPPYPTQFEFLGYEQNMSFDKSSNTIDVEIEEDVDVTALTPVFNFGLVDSVIVVGEKQTSGSSIVDFSEAVVYEVYAGSTVHEYTVNVSASEVDPNLNSLADFYANATQVYPIPAQSEININIGEGKVTGLSLLSMDGKAVLNEVSSGRQFSLNVAGLQRGMYVLKLRYSDGIEVHQKVVLQ